MGGQIASVADVTFNLTSVKWLLVVKDRRDDAHAVVFSRFPPSLRLLLLRQLLLLLLKRVLQWMLLKLLLLQWTHGSMLWTHGHGLRHLLVRYRWYAADR